MAETKVHYDNLADRRAKIAANEAEGLVMLSDDFDLDWEVGAEPHGTMTFTDVVEPSPPRGEAASGA